MDAQSVGSGLKGSSPGRKRPPHHRQRQLQLFPVFDEEEKSRATDEGPIGPELSVGEEVGVALKRGPQEPRKTDNILRGVECRLWAVAAGTVSKPKSLPFCVSLRVSLSCQLYRFLLHRAGRERRSKQTKGWLNGAIPLSIF